MRISMLRSEVRGEIPGPRGELREEIAVMRAEVKAARAELLFKLFFGATINNAILVILVLAVLKLA